MKQPYFLRRLLLTLWLASFALGAAAQAPGGGNTGGPPGQTPGGGTTPNAPGGGNTGGPPSPNAPTATITGFTPTSGPAGTVVTVTGTNLTGTTAVTFNGVNAPTFTVNSATQLTVTVPAGATTGPISAVTPGGAVSSSASFTVVQPPVLSAFTPTSGASGTTVTITGANFSGATAVTFNGTTAPFSVASGTSISATVPVGASTGPIRVTTPAGTGSSSTSFVVPTAPVLSGLRLHLRADAGVSTTASGVSGWEDQSGNDFHTAQATAGQQPAFAASAVNGRPALTLDGADDFLQSAASVDLLGGQTSYTFFVVAKPGATQKSFADIFDYSHSGGVRFVIQQDGSNTNTFYNNGVTAVNQTLSAAGFSVYGGTYVNGSTATSRLNGSNPLSGSAASNSFPQPAAFRVGNWISGGREFNGQIAEVLVYNRALSQAELEQVENYLITKYGIVTQPALTTGTVTPQSFCAGSTITVPFTTSMAAYQAGNQFRLQLSDANGVFDANAPLFGTLQSSGPTGGTLTGVVPATTAGGTGYRVRVVASAPATTGTANPDDLTISPAPVSQAGGPASVAYGGSIALTLTPTYPGATYSWSGPLGFASTQQNPTINSNTNVGVNRYTCVVTLNGCSYSSFVEVAVQPPTAPLLTLGTFAGPLCPSAPITLSFSVSGVGFAAGNTITAQLSDAAGSFAAPTAIGSVAFSGLGNGTLQATLPAATAGSSGYRIRLVGSSPASTSNDNGSDLTVNTPPTVTLAAFAPVCVNAPAFALSGGLPAGGTYRVNGNVASSFNPASAGAGSYTITYSYTDANGCAATATRTLQVQPLPTVTLAALAPACLDAPAYPLTGGSPAGGTYSGPGVSGGQFNPATAGVGTHTITYSYTDGSGCSASATRTLTVLPLPTLAASSTLVCAGQPVTLTVSNTGVGASYAWSTGASTSSITVNPTVQTTYSVTVTNAAGCAYPLNRTINIRPNTATPGAVSQMQPVDNSGGLSLPINFSWAPGADADTYDLFVWPENSSRPATPTVGGLSSLQYTYHGPIPYGQGYQWQVVSRTPCGTTDGPVQTFRLRNLPDVYVSHIVVPDTAYSNQQIEIEWNVSNAGLGSTLAQQWTDEVYVSQDSVFNLATAVSLGRRGNTTYLQPNGTYITTASFPVQLSQAGRYYVFVRADVYGQLLESNENNNRRRAADRVLIIVPETPDFSLENFVSPPDNSIGYTDVQLRYRVFNRGTVPVTQPRFDEYFISPDTIMNIAQNTGRLALGPNAISLGRQRVTDTLLPGGFYQRIVTVRIPHTQFGTRYFYAYSDTDNQIFEVASTNNANKPVPVNVVLRPPADLAPFRLTAPGATVAGVPMNIVWDVRNDGLNPPVAEERFWADQFWLSPTATFDPQTAISVGTLNVFGGDTLQPNRHYRRTVALNIPNGLSGQYYVFGKADHAGLPTSNGNVFEYLYEGNNMIRSAVVNVGLAYADLEPAAFTAPATIDAYQTFTVNYTVRNNSAAPTAATGTWQDEVYIAPPNGLYNAYSCSMLGRVARTGPLAPGQSYSGTMTLTIPRWVRPGEYDLVFVTDQSGVVYEFNFEGNNTARQRITYRYSDDLRATALSSTGTAYSGQNLTVNWQVDNQGAYRTLATQWSDQVFLSVDNVLDNSDLQLASPVWQGELPVGAGYSAAATVRIPHGLQGNYFLIVRTGVEVGGSNCSNASGVLSDTNPANNVRTAALPITLTPPCDLVVQAVTFPTDVVAGQQVQIPFTIRNQGVGATLEGEWNDGIYLNTSPTVNGATRIGNYRRTGVLGAGQSYSVMLNVTIPAYMSGNYYIFLVTDNPSASGYSSSTNWGGFVQYGQVYEHQAELNNTAQSNLLIRVPAPADLVVTSVAVPGSRKLGETMTVHYQVKNQGVNPAVGLLKDGLFLSQDLVLDGAVDRIFASSARNITIQPNQTISGVVKSHVQAVNPGAYHGLMATNLYDDIFEGPANNNNVLAAGNQLQVTADDLPLRTTQPFALDLDSMVFYRVTPGAGKDMVLRLGSNQQFGQNEVYVGYNRVPTASEYDFIYESQVSPTQELLIPSTGPAPYYVLVKTPYVYNGQQTATLFADTLGFQVRSITANRVGQGRVTTRILGANFNRNTRFYLTRGNDTTRLAVATLIRFRSSVDVTVRWFLDSLATGQYHVVAQNGLRRVQLTDGLTVEPKRALSVDFATITPRVVRVGTSANWTYFLKNTSNVDVPYWEFQYNVPGNSDPVVTHTPNVRKKSDFTPSPASASVRNRLLDGTTDVLPFVARDLVPDEVIQVNLRLTPPATGEYPVVWNQAALNEEWYTRQTLDHITRYRQAVLANPGQFPASVASLAANQATWQDSLQRYYQRQGLLDASWLNRPARTGYTALSDSVRLPGGICGTWNVKECPTPFRPDPFGALEYPASLIGCADSIVFTYKGRGATCTDVVGAVDPNLIVGPEGLGERKMVGVQQTLNYQVQFENDPLQATAPAQVVRITVPLSAAFEPRAFRLGDFGWGSYQFSVPANSASHTRLINMPDSLGYDVRVLGTVDVVNRRLLWQFETIDPATGLAPADPNKGFLLINDSTGRGQGFVNFTIKGSATAFTGDSLTARASIVFDTNEPILTNRWWNILDAVAPTSRVAALPATSPQPEVQLTWTAGDDPTGSGLRRYAVYASQDNGPFQEVASNLTTRSYTFTGQPGSRYDFFTLASDSTDNQEALKTVGEAFTEIEGGLTVYNLVNNQCLVSDTIVSTGTGQWQYLRRNGQVVAALNDEGHDLGKVAVQFTIQEGQPVRADGRGTEYFDRNWKVYAQKPFTGSAVKVRFYGLQQEFDRFKAANDGDGNDVSSLGDLRLTQYSGPNEDCLLSNNNFGPGAELRVLTPLTTAGPAAATTPYFVVEATVADHFSEFYLNGGTGPLPVTLSRFGAVRQGRDVLVSWQTAQEKNSAYFVVEAADEPQQGFREVARQTARGNSTVAVSYEAVDRQVPATGGLRYYRLRQVDQDGTTAYSQVVAVALDKAPLTVRALPNPFSQAELQLTLELPEAGRAELHVTDLTGRSVLRRTLDAPAGTTTVALPELARLSRGVYVLTVKVGTTVRQVKLLKD